LRQNFRQQHLVQAGIKFTLTTKHVCYPPRRSSAPTCKTFFRRLPRRNGLAAFASAPSAPGPERSTPVRYSEKILERHASASPRGPSRNSWPGRVKLADSAAAVKKKLAEIKG